MSSNTERLVLEAATLSRTLSMALAVSLLLLAGCGGSDEEPEGAIPQHQLDALKKAENVEDVMQQAQQKRQEQIDEG